MSLDYPLLSDTEAAAHIRLSTPVKIAIQGVHGAFHEIAARSFHLEHDIEIVPADTFDELIAKVESGEADSAVMAIENTIAGSLLRNYNLLNNSNLHIKGEVFLRIKQNLMALPGVKIEDLKSVHSHPIALQQCEDFFQQYPHIKLVEAHDTALVAKQIKEKGSKKIGAIASTLAADIYGMNLLAESIESYKKNYTRFLYLSKNALETRGNEEDLRDFNKISAVFTLNHTVGSLHKVLEMLAKNDCNLTKIQSTPIMDRPWEYMFFVDFTLENTVNYAQILTDFKAVTGELRIFGRYKSGEYVE